MEPDEERAIAHIRALLSEGAVTAAWKALDNFRTCLSPAFAQRDFWRIDELYGACFHDLGDMEGAVQAYWQASQHDRFLRSQMEHFSNYLFALHYLPDIPEEELAQQHFLYGNFYRNRTCFSHVKKSHPRLRIGYLSADFQDHAVGRCILPVLQMHNKDRYEVYCYSLGDREDDYTRAMQEHADIWRNLNGISVEAGSQCIFADEIDILVDLAGHSAGGRTLMLAAAKPAPVQICGLGWFDTTGLSGMDYFLTDRICDPLGLHEAYFKERLLRVPGGPFCYTPPKMVSRPGQLHDKIVFGCFNNFAKITDDMLSCWLKILRRVPGARLILQDTTPLRERQARLWARAEKLGFRADELELRLGVMDYMKCYLDVDIALDTFPYTGGVTTCDALYMGVPVVVLAGRRHGERIGLSLLTQLGLEDLAAVSQDEYIDKAVRLAEDKRRLVELRRGLRDRMCTSLLMDAKTYVYGLEQAYETVWQEWLKD